MKSNRYALLFLAGVLIAPVTVAQEQAVQQPPVKCLDCHRLTTPNIVADWAMSADSSNGVTCGHCHGLEHTGPHNIDKAQLPTPTTCDKCHSEQTAQFRRGKHALGWVSMNAMPTTHYLPMALTEGMKGCGGCHKIGEKTEEDIKQLSARGSSFGNAACDSCHTRHTFSLKEARAPQACQTCHMGFDHPQWEMYSASKHGVRYLLKQSGVLPETTVAPSCQTCHMPEGNHEVRTPWGFLAVRLPLPEDTQWKADQVTILQALGVLDPEGNPTKRLEAVKAADVARLTQEAFDEERHKILRVCSQCHSENFARGELKKGDDMIREADHLLAEAIREIAALYQEGVLRKPETYAYAFPDLLAFHDAPTPIEQEQQLFVMHLEHRMRTFQGTFHANPDYALWYGWSEMKRDLAEIKEEAKRMRAEHELVKATAKTEPKRTEALR
jgi:hypothetical protein